MVFLRPAAPARPPPPKPPGKWGDAAAPFLGAPAAAPASGVPAVRPGSPAYVQRTSPLFPSPAIHLPWQPSRPLLLAQPWSLPVPTALLLGGALRRAPRWCAPGEGHPGAEQPQEGG